MVSMPNLVEWVAPTAQISTTSKVPGFPLLKFLKIEYTPKLKAIPSHDLGSLEELYLDRIEESSLFVNMACNNNLISLRILWISHCKISNEWVSKLIQSSQHHLGELEIDSDDGLSRLEFPDDEEEEEDDDDDGGHRRILLPSLKSLWIFGCDRLESIGFRSGKCRPIPSLQELNVRECPNLASVALETPNLSRQWIHNCPKWKEDIERYYNPDDEEDDDGHSTLRSSLES